MTSYLSRFYAFLFALSALSLATALAAVLLGVVGRQTGFNLRGLDAYAGYSVAAALFLALPETLRHGDHIRVELLLQRASPGVRRFFEGWCLVAGAAVSITIAWFAARLVWVSYTVGDVSPAADATPLWIPQLSMALGTAGFAISMLHATVSFLRGADFAVPRPSDEIQNAE